MKYVAEKLERVPLISRSRRGSESTPRDPVLLLGDVIFDASRTPHEYSMIVVRGDKVQIQFAFEL